MSAAKKTGRSDLTEAARKLGAAGGKKGGPARARALTATQRRKIAKEGAEAARKKR